MFDAAMESFNESLNIGECSVKFCDRLKQLFPDISHTNPKPDQSFLVWTLPSFRGQEACTLCDISNRNCIHRFHATLYQTILESNGDIPGHTLTSELITNMLGVDEETQKNLRSEPTYPIFYAITDAVKKEFDRYSLNNDSIKAFQKSFSQRLFRDAYPFIIKRSASKKPDFSYYRSKYWNDLPPSVWNFQSVKKSIDPNPSYHTLRVPVTPMISHELRPRPAGAGEVSIEEMLRDCDIMDDILAATGHPDESSGGLDGDDGPSGGGDEEYHDTEDGEDGPSDDPPSYPEPPRHHGGSGGSGGSGGPGGPGGSGPSGPPPGPLGPAPGPLPPGASELTKNIEIVILRPNIEHYMLGIIMGLAGENLGNTLWGQTELSVYDDAMHGVWGMSYKYHERAIVFNEKNLIRLWDVAYDGYNGGKEEKHVNWEQDHEVRRFREDTLDVTKNYQGASMMVLAFCHDPVKQFKGRNVYDDHFKRNWPSPILFDDNYDHEHLQSHEARSIVGYDNLHVVDVEEFRVFNNPLYSAYSAYRRMFPPFMELHKTRKSAGESTQEAETTTESLAFQGTMRIKEHGCVKTEIRGSGHHGADFVGAASIRAGKGYKMNIGQPALGHLV
jgi:hypothetical protein